MKNPVPSIVKASLVQETATEARFSISGSDFVPQPACSLVYTPTDIIRPDFISATSLEVDIPSTDFSAGGSAEIWIVNPEPGGGSSNHVTVQLPRPEEVSADAGPTQTVAEGEEVTLDGSDSTGTITSYYWEQLSGPAVDIKNVDQSVASFTVPRCADGILLNFKLTVSGTSSSSVALT